MKIFFQGYTLAMDQNRAEAALIAYQCERFFDP